MTTTKTKRVRVNHSLGGHSFINVPIRPKPTKFSDLTPEEFAHAALCFHEAAHAVAGVLFGGELSTAYVAKGRVIGTQGNTSFTELSTARNPAVALAGPWGEARWNAGCARKPTLRETERVLSGRGRKDHEAIVASGQRVGEVFSEVSDLLDRCWGSIVTVAQQLFRDGEADHRDVCAALSIPAKDNGFHLAHIRGGKAPGSFTVTPGLGA